MKDKDAGKIVIVFFLLVCCVFCVLAARQNSSSPSTTRDTSSPIGLWKATNGTTLRLTGERTKGRFSATYSDATRMSGVWTIASGSMCLMDDITDAIVCFDYRQTRDTMTLNSLTYRR